MATGIAGALLVFTGIWHATEWMMDGGRRDTWRLVPVGIVYAALGYLLVTGAGGIVVPIVALVLAALGGTVAFTQRNQFAVRKWVTWTFIIIDVIIVGALALALLG